MTLGAAYDFEVAKVFAIAGYGQNENQIGALKTVNDEGALRKVIEEIVANNPKSVEDYKAGKKKAMGFFVGQTMRAMKGKADPAMVNQILKEMLD